MVVHQFREDRCHPIRTGLVLRAWACWRFNRPGFIKGHAARALYLRRSVQQLRENIRSLRVADGGTGSDRADTFIRGWCPDVLPASVVAAI